MYSLLVLAEFAVYSLDCRDEYYKVFIEARQWEIVSGTWEPSNDLYLNANQLGYFIGMNTDLVVTLL